jgi:hypothetical protein
MPRRRDLQLSIEMCICICDIPEIHLCKRSVSDFVIFYLVCLMSGASDQTMQTGNDDSLFFIMTLQKQKIHPHNSLTQDVVAIGDGVMLLREMIHNPTDPTVLSKLSVVIRIY